MRDLINKLSLIESTEIDIPKIFSKLTSDQGSIDFSAVSPTLNYHDWDDEDASLHHLTVNRIYLSASDFRVDESTGELVRQNMYSQYIYFSLLIQGKATEDDKDKMVQYTALQEVCRKTIANAGFGNAIAQKLEFHNEWIKVPPEFETIISKAYEWGQDLGMSPPDHLAGDEEP